MHACVTVSCARVCSTSVLCAMRTSSCVHVRAHVCTRAMYLCIHVSLSPPLSPTPLSLSLSPTYTCTYRYACVCRSIYLGRCACAYLHMGTVNLEHPLATQRLQTFPRSRHIFWLHKPDPIVRLETKTPLTATLEALGPQVDHHGSLSFSPSPSLVCPLAPSLSRASAPSLSHTHNHMHKHARTHRIGLEEDIRERLVGLNNHVPRFTPSR